MSTVAFVAGGAAAVAMMTYLLWPAAPASGSAIRVQPVVSAGHQGLVAIGSF